MGLLLKASAGHICPPGRMLCMSGIECKAWRFGVTSSECTGKVGCSIVGEMEIERQIICHVKAARKMLMKLTTDLQSKIQWQVWERPASE